MKKTLLVWLAVSSVSASEQTTAWIFEPIIKEGFSVVPALRQHILSQDGRIEILRNRASERLNQIMFNRALRGIAPYEVQTSRYYQVNLQNTAATFAIEKESPLYEVKTHYFTLAASAIAAYEMVLIKAKLDSEKVNKFEEDRLRDVCLLSLLLTQDKDTFEASVREEAASILHETDQLWSGSQSKKPSGYALLKPLL
jgi:hypothetical protein